MVTTCCVCGVEKGCSQDFNLIFHRFPRDKNLKLQWWKAIGKRIYHNAHVCSKHFKTEDYKNYDNLNLIRKILKPSAIPSIYIDLNKKHIKLEPIENSLSGTEDILTENQTNESFEFVNIKLEHEGSVQNESCDDRLQIDKSSISTRFDDLMNKKTLDNKATLLSIDNQTKKSFEFVNIKLEHESSVQNESCDNRLQIDRSSISTRFSNLMNKKTLDNKATILSIDNQAKKRQRKKEKEKIKESFKNTLRALKKQRYQNNILGVIRREDFINENAWLRFQKYINKINKQYRLESRKNQKLQHDINNFKEVLKKHLSDDVLEV